MIVLSLFKGEIEIDVAPRKLTMREIVADVAERRGFTVDELIGPGRHKRLSRARHEAFALIYAQGRLSLPEIGRRFGGRDHTTVLHGIRAHKARQAGEPQLWRQKQARAA